MLNRAEDLKKWVGEKTDQRVNEALDLMNLASREQVSQLTEKIDKLTRKVQNLEKKLAKKAKEEAARKAAARREQKPRAKVIPMPANDVTPVDPPENHGAETL
jgi:septal ring factor EnvC (AmiA/AmiB activator)